MKHKFKAGTTSKRIRVFIANSGGDPLTALVHNSSGLTAYYLRDGDSSPTQISLVTATVGTFTSGGFKEVHSTNMPGVYELGIPNAALASGATAVNIVLKGATDMRQVNVEIELDAVDYQDSQRFGLASLPSVNPAANGGLPTVNASNQIAGIAGLKNTLDNLNDVSASTIGSECDNSLADAGVTTARMGYLDSLIARLGAFTGSGVNTVLGFLKALGSKAASAPSDMGGTFDPATDSTEAIRDRGDAAWGGSTVIVSPTRSSAETPVEPEVIDAFLFDTSARRIESVVDANGDPLDLSAYTHLVVAIESAAGSQLFSADLTTGVTLINSNHGFSFKPNAACVAAVTSPNGHHQWSLRDPDDILAASGAKGRVLALGEFRVHRASRKQS